MADNSALYGPAGELGGQVIGDAVAQGDYSKIQQLLNELKAGYSSLPGATPVTPQTLGPSAVGGVTEDPRYGGAENEALRQLMELANNGGLSAADKAKLEQAKLSGLSVARGLKGANEASLRSRGLYSSGAELSGDQAAAQAGTDTAYKGDVATASSAADRALQALEAGGQYASALGSRDLNQKDLAAQANDRIGQFNATQNLEGQLYNSPRALQLALAKLKGIGGVDASEIGMLSKLAGGAAAKGGGYGRQAGDLYGALNGGGNAGNLSALSSNPYPGGSSADEWGAYPGTGSDGNGYGGYKLGEGDMTFGADSTSLDDLLGAFD